MMLKKEKFLRALLVAGVISMLTAGTLFAADETASQSDSNNEAEPASLDADEVEYDVKSGIAIARGDVLMIQGDMKVTGAEAEYNTNTKEGRVEGNVIAVQPSKKMRMTAHKVTSDAQQHMVATGDVHGVMEDKTFTGPIIEYFQPKDYIFVKERGTVTSKDGEFTADQMEGFLKEEHLIGRGDAYLNSPPNDLEAGGDLVNYYGLEEGKAILTGHAWAVQGNNTMRGNRLTIFLDKNKDNKVTVAEEPAEETAGETAGGAVD